MCLWLQYWTALTESMLVGAEGRALRVCSGTGGNRDIGPGGGCNRELLASGICCACGTSGETPDSWAGPLAGGQALLLGSSWGTGIPMDMSPREMSPTVGVLVAFSKGSLFLAMHGHPHSEASLHPDVWPIDTEGENLDAPVTGSQSTVHGPTAGACNYGPGSQNHPGLPVILQRPVSTSRTRGGLNDQPSPGSFCTECLQVETCV